MAEKQAVWERLKLLPQQAGQMYGLLQSLYAIHKAPSLPAEAEILDSGHTWRVPKDGRLRYTYEYEPTLWDRAFNPSQRSLTQGHIASNEHVREYVETIIPIKFERAETSGQPEDYHIRFQLKSLGAFAGTGGYPSLLGSVVSYDPRDVPANSAKGSNGYAIELHEWGHALGLQHLERQTNNNAMLSESKLGSLPVTVMFSGYHTFDDTVVESFMPLDIATLQAKYGANHAYHNGDNVYRLESGRRLYTIWDGGGIDTLDASGYTGNQEVWLNLSEDLTAASKVGDSVVYIARNASIERAIGSPHAGNTLIANARGSILVGAKKQCDSIGDIFYGNNGSDVFIGKEGSKYFEDTSGHNVFLLAPESKNKIKGLTANNDVIYLDAGKQAIKSLRWQGQFTTSPWADHSLAIEYMDGKTTLIEFQGMLGMPKDMRVVDKAGQPLSGPDKLTLPFDEWLAAREQVAALRGAPPSGRVAGLPHHAEVSAAHTGHYEHPRHGVTQPLASIADTARKK